MCNTEIDVEIFFVLCIAAIDTVKYKFERNLIFIVSSDLFFWSRHSSFAMLLKIHCIFACSTNQKKNVFSWYTYMYIDDDDDMSKSATSTPFNCLPASLKSPPLLLLLMKTMALLKTEGLEPRAPRINTHHTGTCMWCMIITIIICVVIVIIEIYIYALLFNTYIYIHVEVFHYTRIYVYRKHCFSLCGNTISSFRH